MKSHIIYSDDSNFLENALDKYLNEGWKIKGFSHSIKANGSPTYSVLLVKDLSTVK
jgi:hypothetical protein